MFFHASFTITRPDLYRYIGETVRSIFDITELTVEENIPGLMIFIDFQKAFDSLEWNYLLKCLQYFNFGPDFIR